MSSGAAEAYRTGMGTLMWDMPGGWGIRNQDSAREARKAERAQLQAEAAEAAAWLLGHGVQPPETLEDRVAFIDKHGARVYLAPVDGAS